MKLETLLNNHVGIKPTMRMLSSKVPKASAKLMVCPFRSSELLKLPAAGSVFSGSSPGQSRLTPNPTLLIICSAVRIVSAATVSSVKLPFPSGPVQCLSICCAWFADSPKTSALLFSLKLGDVILRCAFQVFPSVVTRFFPNISRSA